jgi:phosphoribosylformimino-5-aminoimidazole carboxamide ribotide isomerase
MDIIPVIDLKGGEVVHARQGRRDEYRPIQTSLSATSAPRDVVAGLLRLHPFRALYVADLDAIEGRGDNLAALATLPPGLDVWLDAGVRDEAGAAAWRTIVLGSESQADTRLLRARGADPRIVLSLDFRGDAFQGPPEILADPALWPERVIVMTLARVGAGQGPDLARLAEIVARAGGRRVYAAGGVRDAGDLQAAASCGAAGALVATALHSGVIGTAEIASAARLGSRATTPADRSL